MAPCRGRTRGCNARREFANSIIAPHTRPPTRALRPTELGDGIAAPRRRQVITRREEEQEGGNPRRGRGRGRRGRGGEHTAVRVIARDGRSRKGGPGSPKTGDLSSSLYLVKSWDPDPRRLGTAPPWNGTPAATYGCRGTGWFVSRVSTARTAEKRREDRTGPGRWRCAGGACRRRPPASRDGCSAGAFAGEFLAVDAKFSSPRPYHCDMAPDHPDLGRVCRGCLTAARGVRGTSSGAPGPPVMTGCAGESTLQVPGRDPPDRLRWSSAMT